MLKKVIRLLIRLALLAAVLSAGRAALERWVDGPEPRAADRRWDRSPGTPPAAPVAQQSGTSDVLLASGPTDQAPVPARTVQPVRAAEAVEAAQAAEAPQTDAPTARPGAAAAPEEAGSPAGPAQPASNAAKATKATKAAKAKAKPPARPRSGASTRPASPGHGWVGPDESGAAPSTHPVKVKVGSGIYREPGAAGYERTRPDRCYESVEAAEADGFVRAKR